MILKGGVYGPIASRYIVGERVNEIIAAVKTLKEDGFLASIGILQDSLVSAQDYDSVVERYREAIKAVGVFSLGSTVTIKLSSLGSVANPVVARENLSKLFDEGAALGGVFFRLEMESPRYVQETLTNLQQLKEFYPNLGAVVQANLKRSDRDIDALVSAGISIRLVKGAFHEPAPSGYATASEIDASYRKLMLKLLDSSTVHAIATHDEKMIETATRYMSQRRMPYNAVEFEMYKGVKEDLQKKLKNKGYTVRVFTPYGQSWYPYVAKRVAEANAFDLIGGLFRK